MPSHAIGSRHAPLLLAGLVAASLAAGPAAAQVVTDGSLGAGGPVASGIDPADGRFADYLVTRDLGSQLGSALLHSFLQHDVPAGEVATFTEYDAAGGASPWAIQNVIGRVTGDDPSHIFGTIRSSIDGANLFLLNPQGVLFESGAQLDLKGSFHVSSADLLRFEVLLEDPEDPEGSVQTFDFVTGSASPGLPSGSVLAAAPTHFGFVEAKPGIGITGRDAVAADRVGDIEVRALLGVGEDETLSIVGGDVFIDNPFPFPGFTVEVISIENGTIQLAAVDGSGDPDAPVLVPVDVAAFDADELPAGSLPTIQLGSQVGDNTFFGVRLGVEDFDDSGESPGRIVIRGGRLEMAQSSLNTDGIAGAPATPDDAVDCADCAVDVEVREMSMTGGEIASLGVDAHAGRIRLRGGTLDLERGAKVGSSLVAEDGEASGGEVSVEFAERITLRSGAQISTKTLTQEGSLGSQAGAPVRVVTGTLTLDNASINTLTEGWIDVDVTGEVIAEIAGPAGVIEIEAQELTLTNGSVVATAPQEVDPPSGKPELTGLGGGGGIMIDASRVVVEKDSVVAATSFGAASAGDIVVKNGDDGMAESVRVSGGGDRDTRITTRTGEGASGDAGSVTLLTRELVLENGGSVSAAAEFGDGAAGDVTVRAEVVSIVGTEPERPTNRSSILASTAGAGAAGRIDIEASRQLSIADGGQISVESGNAISGQPGGISIRAGDVAISGSVDAIQASSTSLSQDGGSISVTATGDVRIDGASRVIRTASSSQSGGNIDIDAAGTVTIQGADIEADATNSISPTDKAGTIRVAGAGVFVGGGSTLRAAAGRGAAGGSIVIDTPVFLVPGGVLLETTAEGGATRLTSLFGDVFDVTSEFGTSGDLEIQTPESQLTAQVAALPSSYLDVDRLAADQCAARERPAGSLVLQGRDRTPPAPDAALPVFHTGGGTP